MRLHTSLTCINILLLANAVKSETVFDVEDIDEYGLNFPDIVEKIQTSNYNISQECSTQILKLYNNNQQTLWTMGDAWSKFPYPGSLYYASQSDFGNYDECIKIKETYENEKILGKYCAWGWILPLNISSNMKYFLLAYCIPDQCTSTDLNNVIGVSLFNDLYCSTQETDREIDTGATVAISIFFLLFLMAVASTVYDVYLQVTDQKCETPILLAFSFYTNGKKLLHSVKTANAGEQVLCFHGMKFISMWWIISGHGAISWYLAPVEDGDTRTQWQTQRYAQYIASAHISVDTFFYISGFLMAYLYFKQDISKKPMLEQVKTVPSLILHRYLRLTPANAMCFLGSVYLFKYLQDGPFFSFGIHDGLIKPCKKYWWTYFLYIQNYYNFQKDESLCIPTTWYLSADFQLFLVTPLILIPLTLLYRSSFRVTMACLFAINLVFLGLPIYIRLYFRDYDPTFQEYDFHSKLISYFIGIMAGVYMRHERNKRLNLTRTLNLLLWFLALGTMLAVIFYRQDIQIKDEYVSRSLCYSFTRPMWCISLAWITYACVNGYGGVVNWLLSSSFMQLGSKLTYCLYIVHGMVIAHYSLGIRSRIYFTDWRIFVQNCGFFVVSMLVATFWSLSYEAPMIILERLIFNRSKPKPKGLNDRN